MQNSAVNSVDPVETAHFLTISVNQIYEFSFISQDFDSMKESHSELSAKLRESESALSEMGERLSVATLENERLREENGRSSSRVDFGAWQEDSAVSECQLCAKEFGLARRKVKTNQVALSALISDIKQKVARYCIGLPGFCLPGGQALEG